MRQKSRSDDRLWKDEEFCVEVVLCTRDKVLVCYSRTWVYFLWNGMVGSNSSSSSF